MKWRYHSKEAGLADLLNYAHFVEEGIILNKDGAFLQSFQFRGTDIHSATGDELDAIANLFNRAMHNLEDGWMLHIDELRIPSITYPTTGAFPNSVAALIDEERRQFFEAEDAHYENLQFLTFVWKFPLPMVKTTQHWFVEGVTASNNVTSLTDYLRQFKENIESCLALLRNEWILVKLNNPQLLSYLNTCISGELSPITPPADGCFLDVVLGRQALIGGYVPRIGNQHIYALTIAGYLNQATVPGLLEEMSTYPLVYRWSNRFIPLSEATAEREMKRYQKNWNNKIKGLLGVLKETISGKITEKSNVNAQHMSHEITDALTINNKRQVRFGYWTSVIILINPEINILDLASQALSEYLQKNGFSCQREDVNALDAWLGSIPGHGSCNARRLFIHSLNLAHILPLASIWSGAALSSTSSLLPVQSPPVFYAATIGKTPFRFHLDVRDVGHQVIVGPTGSGKSTYLDFLVAQFLRYEQAQIFIFDKDLSHQALTAALGGRHYNLGQSQQPCFCPLADLSTENLQSRACQFIEKLMILQNVAMTPRLRTAIHTGILALAEPNQINHRNLTVLQALVQDNTVRDAIQFYTIAGPMKLLDADTDQLKMGYLQTFEMNWLLAQTADIFVPILTYIFDQIESRLDAGQGQRPTLIILEESWLYISHSLFAYKLKDWLKTLRKKNARVVFATQSLADLYDPSQGTLNSVTAAILESCPTKIFLPNPKLENEIQMLYKKIGLNERQIAIITQMSIPKQHYYLVTPEGNRLLDLGFSETQPLALAFIGLSAIKSRQLLACQTTYGEAWVAHWLQSQGFDAWAKFWHEHYFLSGRATCALDSH